MMSQYFQHSLPMRGFRLWNLPRKCIFHEQPFPDESRRYEARVLNEAAEVLNYESLGFGVRAVVEVRLPSHASEALRDRLLIQPEVLTVAVIAGDGSLSLDVIAVDTSHLHSFVRSLQRSGETATKIVYAEDKSRLTLVERMRLLNEQKGNGLVST